MKLAGFKRSENKRSGGISSLYLVCAEDFTAAEYCRATDSFVSVTLPSDTSFVAYDFKEDCGVFTEDVKCTEQGTRVSHKLSFFLPQMDSAAAAISELLNRADEGLVALFTTNCGESFIVGYSVEFAAERPLRIVSISGTTGRRYADETGYEIVLACDDTHSARKYTGTIAL